MTEQLVPDDTEAASSQYSAFISYSQADSAFVRQLHRRLEAYRTPRWITANSTSPVLSDDGRLKPLFRDEPDLSAAADLTEAVREGLARSHCLIVVCSPAAAASSWVEREIAQFRALHGDRRILSALIAGLPEQAFPPALLRHADGAASEPLAADFRPGQDYHHALLKLVAGIIDAPLDQLVHRHAQRHVRRIIGVSAAAAVSVCVVAALSATAFVAQVNEDAQRRRAVGLGSFMLNDLRKGLQAAGRLDLSMQVNTAALKYLRDEELARLSADQLTQRSDALHALGEDYEKRGDLAGARRQFEEARRTTAALLSKGPNDPKRIFAHAQSQYYVGFINWRDGLSAQARAGFDDYARSAQKLVGINPANLDWQHEVADAETNLGMVDMRQDGDAASAARHFQTALQKKILISDHSPGDRDLQREVADAYGWLADSQHLQGDYAAALVSRMHEREIIQRLITADPRNVEYRADLLGNELGLARIEADQGQLAAALRRLERARTQAVALAGVDPDDADVRKQERVLELFIDRTQLDMGPGRRPLATSISRLLGTCAPGSNSDTDRELSEFCVALRARALAIAGDPAGAAGARARLAHRDDVYSRRWGLNLAAECQPVRAQSPHGRG